MLTREEKLKIAKSMLSPVLRAIGYTPERLIDEMESKRSFILVTDGAFKGVLGFTFDDIRTSQDIEVYTEFDEKFWINKQNIIVITEDEYIARKKREGNKND